MNDAATPPLTTEDCLKIARQGREFWNRWVRTVLEALIAKARRGERAYLERAFSQLPLSHLKPLSEAEWRKLGWERLPRLEIPGDPGQPWIDFAGVDFRDEAAAIDFSGFSFPPETSFKGARFGDGASFDGAAFGDMARFDRARFGDVAHFDGATFGALARFAGATFGRGAYFAGATFGDRAGFAGATFGDRAGFAGATFGDWARFADATFGDETRFDGWTEDRAKGELVSLARRLMPAGAQRDAWVNDRVRAAKPGEFSSISFTGARFAGFCSFSGRTFTGPASFQNARFGRPPEFAGTEGHGFIDPHGMAVTFPRRWWQLVKWDITSETDARIRRLRKIMADIHAQDVERDLFILERQAQRAIAWNDFFDRFKKSEKAGESEPRPEPEGKLWRRVLTRTMQVLTRIIRPLGILWRRALTRTMPVLTRIVRPFGIFKPLGFSLLLSAYGLASNYGRSIARPFVLLLGSVAAFHALYWQIWAAPVRKLGFWDRDLISYSFGNVLPFVNTLSPARGELLKRLFCPTDLSGACIAARAGEIVVPLRVEGFALVEGVVNAALLFLLLQAIRNYFKMTK
jgi:hypothetical protein